MEIVRHGDPQATEATAATIREDGYWRDLLGLDWMFTPLHGPAEVEA